MTKATVKTLKDALLDSLETQITNGVTALDKEGNEVVLPPGAPLLAVAAKFVKDWADEIEKDAADKEKVEKLAQFLNRRRPDITQGSPKLDA
ncbi:hypothetical protein SAMN02983003_0609 [Devosia enhydra]|uniref:Uncharacterized protein n=1 Tax=Devosia enhydra TaxID=665118 RepID=A0A1K2HTN2_9HYPH|nr:hypothetical protein [Devosia enhydra]SFZ81640.1 hypothetical protein SAMN02983003_0609 [Devosia enhydra]